MTGTLYGLTFVSALGCGMVAGAFFTFSTFIMQALARLPAPHGIAAMQSINIVVINPWFMGLLFGTAAACAGLTALSLLAWDEAGSALALAGSLLYIVGTIGVTIACNVPRNKALAALDPAHPESAGKWTRYVAEWTFWNHGRTAAALAAAALLTAALSP